MTPKSHTKPTTPKRAREAAGLSTMDLASKVPCALSTVYKCEAEESFPAHRLVRAAYLAALGLTEEQVAP